MKPEQVHGYDMDMPGSHSHQKKVALIAATHQFHNDMLVQMHELSGILVDALHTLQYRQGGCFVSDCGL